MAFLWFPIGFLEDSYRLLMVALSVAFGSLCPPLLVCPVLCEAQKKRFVVVAGQCM